MCYRNCITQLTFQRVQGRRSEIEFSRENPDLLHAVAARPYAYPSHRFESVPYSAHACVVRFHAGRQMPPMLRREVRSGLRSKLDRTARLASATPPVSIGSPMGDGTTLNRIVLPGWASSISSFPPVPENAPEHQCNHEIEKAPLVPDSSEVQHPRCATYDRTNQQECAGGDACMPFYIHASDPLEKVHLLHGACGTEEIWLC